MKILGYNVDIVEEGTWEDIGAFGKFHPRIMKIQIASDLCEQQKASTLVHEVLEAINYILDLQIEHDAIARLEVGLHQVVADNYVELKRFMEGIW